MADGGALVEVRKFSPDEVANCSGLTPLSRLADSLAVDRSVLHDRALGRGVREAIGVANFGTTKRGRHSFWALPKENAEAIIKLRSAGFNAVDACRIVARRREILSALEGLEE